MTRTHLIHKLNRAVIYFWIYSSLTGCVSLNSSDNNSQQPMPITDQTPIDKGLAEAVQFGGQTMQDLKQLLHIRGEAEEKKAGQILESMIQKNHTRWKSPTFINAVHLYLLYPGQKPTSTFRMLVSSKQPLSIQMGWHIASELSSQAMASEIEEILTSSIVENRLNMQMVPDMADALISNQLRGLYTIARNGLFSTHKPNFAKAMAYLRPNQSKADFLEYLAMASPEELRQLNLTSIDLFTCMEILQHLDKTPPPINHKNFENLFYFAISRNTGLSTLSRNVLQNFIPSDNASLAVALARQPIWVQAAFVEGSRRQLTPKLSLFLRELRETTSQDNIIQEIDTVIQ